MVWGANDMSSYEEHTETHLSVNLLLMSQKRKQIHCLGGDVSLCKIGISTAVPSS